MLIIKKIKKEVSLANQEKLTILDVEELNLSDGQQAVICGPSGSGKTTLLNVIAGLTLPTSGEVWFDGQQISELKEEARDLWRAQHIGYIFQKFNLLEHLSVVENVKLAVFLAKMPINNEVSENIKELLYKVGLGDKLNIFPSKLSIGEQQRVGVVRALVTKPKLLLADEPTASLDKENALQVINLLKDFSREFASAMLISSHDPMIISQFETCIPINRPQGGKN